VHGITTDFLKDKPVFAEIYMDFIDFAGSAQLVAHNAEFDMKFLNFELRAVGHPDIAPSRVTDTLAIARKKFPGSPASLDALCRRFEIDLSGRDLHGALLDAQLLADVYLELMGGRQHGLGLGSLSSSDNTALSLTALSQKKRTYREPRIYNADADELSAHAQMVKKLNDPLWQS
jgi:DNA polymerase-3 subunit epsilon